MIGNDDITKTLKMMHNAARYEFDCNNIQRGIDILNDARIIEERVGFKNQAAESMLEISDRYFRLKNYDLAFLFANEAIAIIPQKTQNSTMLKANNLLQTIKKEYNKILLS